MDYDVEEATNYLLTGGLGEVIGLTDVARQYNQNKVQLDTDLSMAICLLADEAVKARKKEAA